MRKTREMLYHLLEVGRSESGCFICHRFHPALAVCDVLGEVMETMGVGVKEGEGLEPDGVAEFAARRGIYLNIASEVDTLAIFQDETKFRQIIGNLLKNAIHYRRERMEIDLDCDGQRCVIDVADDGPGIDPAHHDLVFQRYAQVKECSLTPRKGHGLGLAGALVLARCLGGDIEIRSQKGSGARFRLTLPVKFDQAQQEV